MGNLFSIFDPQIGVLGISFNWVSAFLGLSILPVFFWKSPNQINSLFSSIVNHLNSELKMALGALPTPGITHVIISILIFIALNNFLGLLPYIFTSSSHLTFTLSLALSGWLGYMVFAFVKDLTHSLAHFVPLGTPYPLMPFMVLIEITSSIIRPLTLSVRLAANMVAGHLLLALISGPASASSLPSLSVVMVGLLLMSVLEMAVALIQSYVFSTLTSLYIIEVNTPKVNK